MAGQIDHERRLLWGVNSNWQEHQSHGLIPESSIWTMGRRQISNMRCSMSTLWALGTMPYERRSCLADVLVGSREWWYNTVIWINISYLRWVSQAVFWVATIVVEYIFEIPERISISLAHLEKRVERYQTKSPQNSKIPIFYTIQISRTVLVIPLPSCAKLFSPSTSRLDDYINRIPKVSFRAILKDLPPKNSERLRLRST